MGSQNRYPREAIVGLGKCGKRYSSNFFEENAVC
jgi:hypothetical protein